jgi:hypothetical protein
MRFSSALIDLGAPLGDDPSGRTRNAHVDLDRKGFRFRQVRVNKKARTLCIDDREIPENG